MRRMEFEVHKVPMHDTGLGREAGFKDDKELVEAAKAEREKLDPKVREILERAEAEAERKFLFGE